MLTNSIFIVPYNLKKKVKINIYIKNESIIFVYIRKSLVENTTEYIIIYTSTSYQFSFYAWLFMTFFFFVHSFLLFYRNETVMMTSEEPSTELNLDNKGSKRPIRPKLLKLTDVQMPNRSRKKNRFKVWWIDIYLCF